MEVLTRRKAIVLLGASVLGCKSLPVRPSGCGRLGSVGMVGLGTMGGEIAAYLTRRGSRVYGVDIAPEARLRAAKQGLIGIYGRIDDLPRDLDTVIEAVPEDPSLKGSILEQLSSHISESTCIGMLSSTIPCSSYTDRVANPQRLMNTHILPDLRTRRFVELQGPGKYTERARLEAMAHAFQQKGLAVAIVNGESPGYIFNQIWHNMMFTMFDLMREHSPVTIEYSCREYFGMPYGGIMAMDLIGYDTLSRVFGQVEATMGIPVPKVVAEMNRKGIYGLKSGRGFFEYDSPDLEGFHKTGRKFRQLYPGWADQRVGERIWREIREGARRLVVNGQDPDDVFTAVRHGFPIEKPDLLKDLNIR